MSEYHVKSQSLLRYTLSLHVHAQICVGYSVRWQHCADTLYCTKWSNHILQTLCFSGPPSSCWLTDSRYVITALRPKKTGETCTQTFYLMRRDSVEILKAAHYVPSVANMPKQANSQSPISPFFKLLKQSYVLGFASALFPWRRSYGDFWHTEVGLSHLKQMC